MNVLRHFKRHYNIETETVVMLVVKQMRIDGVRTLRT